MSIEKSLAQVNYGRNTQNNILSFMWLGDPGTFSKILGIRGSGFRGVHASMTIKLKLNNLLPCLQSKLTK